MKAKVKHEIQEYCSLLRLNAISEHFEEAAANSTDYEGFVYSDRIEHSARRFRADLPPFQSNLSALLSTPFRKSSAYLSGYECNDRFSIPPESLFRAL